MWARPVIPGTSRSAPTSTWVKKEKTGATGRSQTSTVSPFSSFLTVIFFSKDATSWADAQRTERTSAAVATSLRITPPLTDDVSS